MNLLRRSTGKVVLVADVGDMSVGVCIARLSKNGPAQVLANIRNHLTPEKRSRKQGTSLICAALTECITEALAAYHAQKSSDGEPHAAYIILRSPWTLLRTAYAEESYPEPRTVTRDMITQLGKKALISLSELNKESVLEAGVLQVFLNGYQTAVPLGKHVTRMSISVFKGYVNSEVRNEIESAVAALLPGRTLTFRSGEHAMLTVLREHIPDIHKYVILDVGGSVTSCTVVRKESVAEFALIKEGFASIIERISKGGFSEEILSQLRLLATDTCTTEVCKKLKDSLARTEPDLVKVYGEVFAPLAAKRSIPNRVMLTAPEELIGWLHGFFSRIDFAQFTTTMQPFTVESLTPETLRDATVWRQGATADAGVSIAAGYVNILEQLK